MICRPWGGISLVGMLLVGCSKPDAAAAKMDAPPPPKPIPSLHSSASAVKPIASTASPSDSAVDQSAEPPEQPDPSESARWIVDEPTNVGVAGPASASPQGIVMVDRHGELRLAKVTRLATSKQPGPTRIERIDETEDAFFAYGVGPAVVGQMVYFINGQKLIGRPIESGSPRTLASDARAGSRVVATGLTRDDRTIPAVGYIAQVGDRPVSRLWVDGESLTLSPEGAAASSVDLVARDGDLIAVALEGRSGMSPVHARRVRVTHGKLAIAEDRVVWVGGSSQALTEVKAAASPADAWAFIAIERDTTHFGLARIHLGRDPKTDSPVTWRQYPNGLDPAPVATTSLCGEPVVLYARPSTATPRAPQELHLAAITDHGLSASQKVAFAGSFTNVSAAPLEAGVLVSYVGDGRTWAVTVRCAAPQKTKGGGS